MALRACLALLLLIPVAACTADGNDEGSRSSPKATYELPPRPVRDGEKAVKGRTVRGGETAFTVIGYTGAMPELVGSHADVAPKGRYVRLRIIVENVGRTNQTFRPARQLLVVASGRTAEPDREAMLVKRQPEELQLGAGVRVELDLWYDVPRTDRPTALRVTGAPGVGAVSEPPPADIKLP